MCRRAFRSPPARFRWCSGNRPVTTCWVAEDHPLLCELLAGVIGEAGLTVRSFSSSAAFAAALERDPVPDLAIIDWVLADGPAAELVHRLLESTSARCIVMSGHRVTLDRFPEHARHRLAFLEKPFAPKHLRAVLEQFTPRTKAVSSASARV